MTTDELIARFGREHQAFHDLSAGRRIEQDRILRDLEAEIGHGLDELQAEELRTYLATLVARGLAPGTVRKYLMAVRPFARWMWRVKAINAERLMEIEDVDAPRGANAGVPRPYTRKDLKRFFSEFDYAYPPVEDGPKWVHRWEQGTSRWGRVQPYAKRTQMMAITCLALHGAIRREEIYRLELEDMTPEAEYIVVRGARKNRDGIVRDRAVPWNTKQMRSSVEAWLDLRARIRAEAIRRGDSLGPASLADVVDSPWLSLHTALHYAKPMRFNQFGMLLRNVGRGWEFHRMRHTAATEMLRAEMPLEKVQRILGHARLQQTLAYAELLKGDIVRAAAKAEPELSRAVAFPEAA